MSGFYFITKINENQAAVKSETTKKALNSLLKGISNDESLIYEYQEHLLLAILQTKSFSSTAEFWNSLNQSQRVLWTFTKIDNSIKNGGIEAILLESYEYVFAILNVWEKLGQSKIKTDFETLLATLLTPSYLDDILNHKKEIGYETFSQELDDEAKYNLIVKQAEIIENYYYDIEFKTQYYNSMISFVNKNLNQFIKE